MFADIIVLMVERAPPVGCPSIYVPSQEFQVPSASLEEISNCKPDLDFFQITVFVLRLGTCEILHVPFKSEVSVSCAPIALLYASSVGLQNQMFWGLLSPWRRDSWLGEPDMRPVPITL